MPPHYDGFMMSVSGLFKNISGNIVLMAEFQRHLARVESGSCQRLARLLQNMALGFPLLPNPGSLLIAQLDAQLGLGGRILRSAVLQQLPWHRLEHMKQVTATSGVRRRRDPTYWTMRWEFSDSSTARRIRISSSLEVRVERCSGLYIIPHGFPIPGSYPERVLIQLPEDVVFACSILLTIQIDDAIILMMRAPADCHEIASE